ncbi:serine threonine isoform A [Micractinium conductrix]|uniref:Serine threonine isoform A n=1 Tax=Micractinium conductrix TaxID=554055 RepID=A0A2P6VQ78_9CHLO|nr:serine threonine isoform A [Micractinium conductrix]|eukprot:PSC76215.1 serine threonine isoform A [Micractinium conductrix]
MARAARGVLKLRNPAAVLLPLVLLLAGAAQAVDASAAHCLQLASSSTIKCAQCQEGYYAGAGGECVQCSTAIKGCVQCQSGRRGAKCTMCRAGTRLKLWENCCERCSDRNCLLCPLTPGRCSTCKEGWVPDFHGRCIQCVGCKAGCRRDGTCPSGCLPGFGKVKGRCFKCRQSKFCDNCDGNPAVCLRCRAVGRRLVNGSCEPCPVRGCALCKPDTDVPVCQKCGFGWFKYPGGCAQCQRGCEETACRPDGTCTKCKSGYGLSEVGECFDCNVFVTDNDDVNKQACAQCDGDVRFCRKCKTHFGLFPGGTCKPCSWDVSDTDTCEQCDGNVNKCSSCSPYEFMTSNRLCKQCWDAIPNCATCRDARTCTQCAVGYALVGGRCKACPSGCDDCGVDPARCLRCASFHVLDRGTGRPWWAGDPPRPAVARWWREGFATKLPSPAPRQRHSLCGLQPWLLCERKRSLPADTRRCEECAEGFYATAAGECRLCDGCAGPCRADGTCSTTCLSGHGLVRGRCLQCASSLCSNCDGNRRACKRCLPLGYGLSRGRCKPCPLAGCEECADGLATCRTCTFRWVLRPDGTCQECDKGCHTGHCQPDGTCTKCTPGWGLVEGQCEQCEVVGAGEAEGNRCLNCDGDTLSCRQCGQGWGVLDYEGFEGACYQCFNATRFGAYGQCAFCDNDLARCSRCPPYTYLSPGPGKCLPCSKAMPKCRSCQDSRTCTDCWDGYALIKKRCVACPRGCADCGADPTRCARCDSSHVLDRVGKRCVPL